MNTLRKEGQLKKVYEVEVKTQAHPLVPKPQLHMTPSHSYVADPKPFLDSFQLERNESSVHLGFKQPLRTLSNANVGGGIQWLQYFCLVADHSVGHHSLSAWLKNNGIPSEQAAAIETEDVQDVVLIEQRLMGVQLMIVVAIEGDVHKHNNLDGVHLLLFIDGHLQDKALFDCYMTVIETKVKVCQQLNLQSVQSVRDVVLIAANQQKNQQWPCKPEDDLRKGIEQIIMTAMVEAIEKKFIQNSILS